MKRFFLFALVATVFAACSTDATQDLAPEIPTSPDELYVSFDEESRVQLNAECKTVWTKDDLVSVFYYSDANDCWRFKGETGDRNGLLIRKTSATPTVATDEVVVVYPYNADYRLATSDKTLSVRIPAVQHYEAGSYGVGANLMVSTGTSNNFSLKSVCGWIKLQFTGSSKITKITLRGNDDEQIAGLATINYADYSLSLITNGLGDAAADDEVGGTLVDDADYVREITLDCGEGIALNSETPTAFYFVLAPQTFTQGITITATCDDGTVLTKATENAITIERNHILPMASIPTQPTPPADEIWYTSSDSKIVEPYKTDVFGATILSNNYENGKGIIKFNGNVTSIGKKAFQYCEALTSITIPNSVTSIGAEAFRECSALESITIPNSVTSIGEEAFWSCRALTCVTIPDSVTSIGEEAFRECSALTSITIPNSVTSIGDSAFKYCYALTSTTIPNSVTSIGDGAFGGCEALESFYGKFASENNRCLIIDGVLKAFAPAGLTSYTIPNSVISIGDYAFLNCSALTSITIPDSVTSIGGGAFQGCKALTSVTIGNSVTSIGNSAFYNCSALESITIPDSVTSIGNSAFYNCSALESITIPDSVTSIGNSAFYNCSALESITIPDSVTSIGNSAFSSCSALESVTIGNGVTSIGYQAFWSCRALTCVTIPDSVTSIGEGAFAHCSALKEVYCKPTTPPTGGSGMFGSNASDRKIYVPAASVDTYKAAAHWSEYKDSIFATPIPLNEIWYTSSTGNIVTPYATDVFGATILSNTYEDGKGVIKFNGNVSSIGDYAFRGCYALTSVTIPNSVTSIGDWAFQFCEALESITIPNSVTSIGEGAFCYCSALKSVTIPNSVTSIGYQAFGGCEALESFYGKFASEDNRCLIIDGVLNSFAPAGLTSYTIPNSVTSIGDWAFAYCSALKSVTIPDKVTSIGYAAFIYCSALTSVTIPDSVTSIGDGAFSDCYALKSITIPNSVTSIEGSAFSSCSALESFYGKFASEDNRCLIIDGILKAFAPAGLTSYTIPNSVTSIESGAFWGCRALTSITIPNSVTSIGGTAFENCFALKEVYCKPTTPPTGGHNMFYYNASGRKIYVPTESVDAYKAAPGWRDYADSIEPYEFTE